VNNPSLSPPPGSRSASGPAPSKDGAALSPVDRWLRDAQAGSRSALGHALEAARKYLLLVANRSLDDKLRAKGGASDLVQDTLIAARQDFQQFVHKFDDKTEPEFLAWLTGILFNRIKNNRRYWESQKHDINREVPAEHRDGVWGQLNDHNATPGTAAVALEEQRRVQRALAQLAPAERDVIIARSFNLEPFLAIGQRLGCSEEAARKRWVRAIRELQKVLERDR
jgi:RNA polymerase sigma-70 factor (ECF subfamily)